MAETPRRSPLIAVDSNVLLDRANEDELVQDALDTVRRRIRGAKFIVTPTVIEETVLKSERGEEPIDRRLGKRVLANLVYPWGFQPMNFIPVGRGSGLRASFANTAPPSLQAVRYLLYSPRCMHLTF